MNGKYEYIFIDEISMVQEMYYNCVIYVKLSNPKIKFTVAGEVEQLLLVKDRFNN